jgi:hypothetical protein
VNAGNPLGGWVGAGDNRRWPSNILSCDRIVRSNHPSPAGPEPTETVVLNPAQKPVCSPGGFQAGHWIVTCEMFDGPPIVVSARGS